MSSEHTCAACNYNTRGHCGSHFSVTERSCAPVSHSVPIQSYIEVNWYRTDGAAWWKLLNSLLDSWTLGLRMFATGILIMGRILLE